MDLREKLKKGDKVEFEYTCLYCTPPYTFKQSVGSFGGGVDGAGKNIQKVSSQVKCPQCKNILKTWGGK